MRVDPTRVYQTDRAREAHATGIYVRAQLGETWGSFDIAELDKASLLDWLRSDGGSNKLAENTVGIILGHGHLHD